MSARIGLIGAGKYGPVHFKTFLQLQAQGKAELVAFAARTPETVENRQKEYGVKGYTDYRKMLSAEQLDAVVVATPDHLHREMTLRAIEMGKHVLVEKPMDVMVQGCREMISSAEKNNVLLQVDFHKRFDPYHQKLHRLVRDGALGEIQYGYANMETLIVLPRDWFASWAARSSPVWLVGIHMFDLARWLLEKDATGVYATGQKGKLAGLGIDVYDSIQTKIEFDGGPSVSVDSSWIMPERFEGHLKQSIKLVGTEGFMEVDSQDRGAVSCLTGEGTTTYNEGFMSEWEDLHGRPVYRGYAVQSVESFVENVNYLKAGGDLAAIERRYPSGKDGLEVTRIAAAAHKSLEEKRVVQVRELQ